MICQNQKLMLKSVSHTFQLRNDKKQYRILRERKKKIDNLKFINHDKNICFIENQMDKEQKIGFFF